MCIRIFWRAKFKHGGSSYIFLEDQTNRKMAYLCALVLLFKIVLKATRVSENLQKTDKQKKEVQLINMHLNFFGGLDWNGAMVQVTHKNCVSLVAYALTTRTLLFSRESTFHGAGNQKTKFSSSLDRKAATY